MGDLTALPRLPIMGAVAKVSLRWAHRGCERGLSLIPSVD
jgi:hypothetical protein